MPSVQTLVNALAHGLKHNSGFKFDSYAVDAGAAQISIGKDFSPVIICDPGGGAIDMLLPAEADSEGLVFIIFNSADAAEAITVKEDSDTTTIVTLAQGEGGIVFCDGTTWRGFVGANT